MRPRKPGLRPKEITIKSWRHLWELYEKRFTPSQDNEGDLWVFRGHQSSDWYLETVFDRYRHRFGQSTPQLIEEGLVRQFQRVARNTRVPYLPRLTNFLEWLALMRHHGAPTRLLDWTYSFATAILFATEATLERQDCAIWAINVHWCNLRSRNLLANKITAKSYKDVADDFTSDPYMKDRFREYFARVPAVSFVYRINPYLMNERLSAQQGLFLCPGNIGQTFEENLAVLGSPSDITSNLVKLLIPHSLHQDFLQRLHQLNLSMERFFPGMDGIAQALHSRLAVPNTLVPRWRERRWTTRQEHFGSWHEEKNG